jgi:hypothetical protein
MPGVRVIWIHQHGDQMGGEYQSSLSNLARCLLHVFQLDIGAGRSFEEGFKSRRASFADFRFGPIADIRLSFDHLIGLGKERCGTTTPSVLAVFRLITSSNFVGRITGKSVGLVPFKILPA